ncbi:hypothetical protein [Paracoccus beibuensis]|uniref:hypothetical protein n=1 Tax=Paracoccus beibuensis TaxID=547602 RepID=UPI002240E263|nr:hypothetical protein [Paracoccus beibuensis]
MIFVIAGIGHAIPVTHDSARLSGPLLPPPPQITISAPGQIPELYLDPVNIVMWALLASIWAMVLLDAAGQFIDPSDDIVERGDLPRIWPLMSIAVLAATALPWLLRNPFLLTAVAALGALCAIIAAGRAAGHHRPAIGFLAGWSTAVFSATLAGLAADKLPIQALSALAILPGAAIGMVAQIWIGSSVGYSLALIWAFCGLAVTTMGSDPMIALAAILGISGMATVLVRAAS